MLARVLIALLVTLLAGPLSGGGAQAQRSRDLSLLEAELSLPGPSSLSPSTLLGRLAPTGAYQLRPGQPQELPEATLKAQRQARLMVSMGSGMLASAPLHIALMSQLACDGAPKASYVWGGLMGFSGLVLTLVGAQRLAPRAHRQRTSPARKFGLVVLALASLTAAELLMIAVSSSDMMCSDG